MSSIAPSAEAPAAPLARLQAYVALTKPRIIELLLVTTLPAMILAREGLPSLVLIVATLAGGTLAAGGANALNMYFDRDIDKVMGRTKGRPLVTGVLTPTQALVFALGIEAVAFFELWFAVNLLSALLALSATVFYVGVYTLILKRNTAQNIVIGGAAGAVPVLVGWAAVTDRLAWPAVLLFAVVFFWTPPHFWALAVRYRRDYEAANVPMLPVVTTARKVANQVIAYSVVVWAVTMVLIPIAHLGWIYGSLACLLGAGLVFHGVVLRRNPTSRNAMRLFGYSISYLTLLFAGIVVDVLVRHP